MPQKGGDLSARRTADFSINTTATGVLGLPATGSATIYIDFANAAGQLISSGNGSASLAITTNSPLLTASLNGIGAAGFVINTNTPTLGAKASLIASATITFTGGITPYAIGIMRGTTEEAGLTNAGIANSVWNSLLANYNETGSAGKALSLASSGGVDITALVQAMVDEGIMTTSKFIALK